MLIMLVNAFVWNCIKWLNNNNIFSLFQYRPDVLYCKWLQIWLNYPIFKYCLFYFWHSNANKNEMICNIKMQIGVDHLLINIINPTF